MKSEIKKTINSIQLSSLEKSELEFLHIVERERERERERESLLSNFFCMGELSEPYYKYI